MKAIEALEKLTNELFQFKWFVGTGIDVPKNSTLFVYVKSIRHPELKALKDGYNGYPVIIEKTGKIKPAKGK